MWNGFWTLRTCIRTGQAWWPTGNLIALIQRETSELQGKLANEIERHCLSKQCEHRCFRKVPYVNMLPPTCMCTHVHLYTHACSPHIHTFKRSRARHPILGVPVSCKAMVGCYASFLVRHLPYLGWWCFSFLEGLLMRNKTFPL